MRVGFLIGRKTGSEKWTLLAAGHPNEVVKSRKEILLKDKKGYAEIRWGESFEGTKFLKEAGKDAELRKEAAQEAAEKAAKAKVKRKAEEAEAAKAEAEKAEAAKAEAEKKAEKAS